jgi:predicted component of type VI protein secretion system
MISARHCTVSSRDGLFWVRDEGSRNGTWVSGVRLPEGIDTVVEVRLFNLALRMDIAVENTRVH